MPLRCHRCACVFQSKDGRRKLCDDCRPKQQRPSIRSDSHLSPAMVDAILERSVRMECARADQRHPIPWD